MSESLLSEVTPIVIVFDILLPLWIIYIFSRFVIRRAQKTPSPIRKWAYFGSLSAIYAFLITVIAINFLDMRQSDIPSKYPEVTTKLNFEDRTLRQIVYIHNNTPLSFKDITADILFDWPLWRTWRFLQITSGPRDLLYACRVKRRQENLTINYTNWNNGLTRNITPNVKYFRDIPIRLDIPMCIKSRGFNPDNSSLGAGAVLQGNTLTLEINGYLLGELNSVKDLRHWLYQCTVKEHPNQTPESIDCHLQGYLQPNHTQP